MSEPLSVADLRDLADAWAVSLRAAGKTRETIRVYGRNVGQFLTYCEGAGVQPLHRRSMEAFLADLLERGREGMTARGRLTANKMFARWLLEVGEIDADPFAAVPPPRIDTKVVQPLGMDEILAMLASCKTTKSTPAERAFLNVRDEAILRLMLETGLRAGEVVGLLTEDVRWKEDPPSLTVRKAKSRRGRNVPFSAQAAQAVGAYLRARRRRPQAASPMMWLGARGTTLSYAGLYDALAARAERAGVVGFHPHRMRHTAAHRWLAAGGSEGGLMTVAGWSRGDMLQRYTRGRAEQRAADEARGLNLGDI